MSEYIIYCDESDKRGVYYSNFYGGALVDSKNLMLVNEKLNQKKHSLNLNSEVKWSKVTENYYNKYIELIDVFFDFIIEKKIKIRIMFTQNIHEATELTEYHKKHEYFLLYYQFLKHSFGLQYSNPTSDRINIRIYLDELPDTREKAKQFKSYIQSLSNNAAFRAAKIEIPLDQIADVDSRKHVILQCLDIVLGAIHFRLNDKHLEKLPNKNKRGKRTIAKERLYKHILKRIYQLYPRFNIGITTSLKNKKENVWHHEYRHWLFMPINRKINSGKSKKRAIKNPASATARRPSHVARGDSQ